MTASGAVLEARPNPNLTFDRVEREIRKRNYGVVCTTAAGGRPHAAGVMYAVSSADRPFALNIVTDKRSKKARNIANRPEVAFVIPAPRIVGFLPPNSIQFQGTAELLPLADGESRRAFESSLVLRRVLRLQLEQKEEVSVFVRVHPGRAVFTYGVGLSILQLMKHVEGSSARVDIPGSRI